MQTFRTILPPTTGPAKSDVFDVTTRAVLRAQGQSFNGDAKILYLDAKGNWLPYTSISNSGYIGTGQNVNVILDPGIYMVEKAATVSVTGIEALIQ